MRRFLRRTDLRPNAQRDVSDELRFHLEMRAQEFIEAGMSPENARDAAARAFGDVSSIGAELRASRNARARTRERRDRMHEMLQDVTFAARTLRKNAAFTIAALATLALGRTTLGLLGAFALRRVVTSLLYGVSATDAPTYAASAAAIVAVTLLATFIPARRATRVDPTSALRAD